MKSILQVPSVILTNFISKLILPYFVFFKFNVRYKNLKEVYKTRGPFLFLPNHTNQWDPFIICLPVLRPVRWVAADAVLRSALRTILLMCGVIPKMKGQSDMLTIQELRKAVKLRHIGGIFLEGKQNWDGTTSPMIPSTAKLVRFLKVPVIIPIFKGGYLTKPRWAWKARRCRIEVHFKRVINAEEIQTMKLAEIEQRLSGALKHDEYEWQRERMIPIRSKIRAEHLELVHYLCPSCEEIGKMESKGNDLFCECGYTVHVDRYGFFQYPEEGPEFASPRDWVVWQDRMLADRIQEALASEEDPVLLRDADVVLMQGKRAMPMEAAVSGEARLYRNRIEIGSEMSIPLSEITGVNTFKQQMFEFHYQKFQCRFQMPTRSVSGYKWEVACRELKIL